MKLDNAHIVDTETPKRKLKKQDGFTLIEVLIAVTIFAVGLLAIGAMQTSAIRMNSTGNRLTELSTLGIDRLENLMSLPYNAPLLAAGTRDDPTPPPGFTVTYTVQQDFLTLNTKSITMTVSGNGKTLRLTSVRAQSL